MIKIIKLNNDFSTHKDILKKTSTENSQTENPKESLIFYKIVFENVFFDLKIS